MIDDFAVPGFALEFLELVESFLGKIEPAPFHVFVVGHPADGSFAAKSASADAIDNPFEDAHVFAVTGPEKFAFGIFAEPVHVEDARRDAECARHLDPVTEIIARVIAAEWQHGHWIASYFADGSCRCGGHFRSTHC